MKLAFIPESAASVAATVATAKPTGADLLNRADIIGRINTGALLLISSTLTVTVATAGSGDPSDT